MRTLVLSCNTGEGHNSAAAAIKEYFQLQGEICEIEDSLGFMSEKISKLVSEWHVLLYRHMPAAFGAGYGFFERHPAWMEEGSAVYKMFAMGTKKLYEYICANEYDTVICTHVFSALLVTRMMEKYPCEIKTALVHTDYTCFPGTSACNMDVFFVPHSSLIPLFEAFGIESEKLLPAAIPVRQDFFKIIPKREAKERLGLDPNKKHIVMMCGSMGCGPIEETAEIIAERMGQDCQLTIVFGTNARAKERAESAHLCNKNIRLLGFTKDIPLLLDSADVYFTKPGGISTSEAAKKCVPMVLIQAVEGCETHNYRFFTKQGAAVLSSEPEVLADMGLEIIASNEKIESMSLAYDAELKSNGAATIYNHIKNR